MTKSKPNFLAIVLSFFAIYIIWGSTYLFVAFAVEEIPPLILASVRFFIASIAILIICLFTADLKSLQWPQVKHSMIAGFMFLTLGNGAMCYALQYIDTGFSALMISVQPLVIILMMRVLEKVKISPKAMIGCALGMFGMYLLVSQKDLVSGPNQWKGLLAMVSCLFTWGYASLYVRHVELPKSHFVNSAIQMAFASISLFALSFIFGEAKVDWFELKDLTYFSMIYLIIFGSVAAFTAFNFLLQHIEPEKVATSTYINPLVAILLGWYFRDEIISSQTLMAAGLLLIGVYFINTNKKKSIIESGTTE